MFRPIALALSCCVALAPLAARAGDSTVDATLNAAGTTPGWVRSYLNGGGSTDERFVAVARAPDGGYVLAGRRAGGAQGALIFLAKFRPDGSYDANFGGTAATGNAGTGRVLKDAWLSTVADMTVDAQGRIVVVGSTPGALGQSDFGVVRFKADGSDDTGFAGDGGTAVAFDFDAANSRVNDMPGSVTTAPDGSIFVAGTAQARSGANATSYVGVVKLKADGSPDEDFGTLAGGRDYYCSLSCGNVLSVARIVYTPDNYIVIGGDRQAGTNDTDWYVVTHHVLSAIPQETSYAVNLGGGSSYQLAYMTDIAVQADGKPVALGWANDPNLKATPVLLRVRGLFDTGEDTSFGNQSGRGMMVLWSWVDSTLTSLAFDSLGRIVLAGEYAPFKTGIAGRLTSDGGINSSFNGTTSPSAYRAKVGASTLAYRTVFKRLFLDGGRPVLAGEATYSTSDESDYDLVMTRLESDLIFANGYD